MTHFGVVCVEIDRVRRVGRWLGGLVFFLVVVVGGGGGGRHGVGFGLNWGFEGCLVWFWLDEEY